MIINHLLILSLFLNFILFFILLFNEDHNIRDINSDSYVYSYSERKLYLNNKCFVTFRKGSSNHKVFEYLIEYKKLVFDTADIALFPPNLERSSKKTMYMMNLPDNFVKISSSYAILLIDIKTI